MTQSLFSAPYRVLVHEHVDDEFVKVTIRCLGYPTHGTQPDVFPFSLKVLRSELAKWPLGASVRLVVTA